MDNPNRPVQRCEHDIPLGQVCIACTAMVRDIAPDVTPKKDELGPTRGPLGLFDSMLKAGMVNSERGNIYGHPTDNFTLIQELKERVRACKDPVAREALESICVKIARLVHTWDHLDSWIDIAGYARCAAMHLTRKKSANG